MKLDTKLISKRSKRTKRSVSHLTTPFCQEMHNKDNNTGQPRNPDLTCIWQFFSRIWRRLVCFKSDFSRAVLLLARKRASLPISHMPSRQRPGERIGFRWGRDYSICDLRINQARSPADALHPSLTEFGRFGHQCLGRPDGAVVVAFGALNPAHPLLGVAGQ